MKHLLSAQQYQSVEALDSLMKLARDYKKNSEVEANSNLRLKLTGKIIATVFFEPSTRTRLSFESAALRLGAQIISCENATSNASSAKGESIEDMARVLCGYADAMVIRHPEKQSVARAADVSSIPVINAGDGTGEHPTQGLLDIFTMCERFGTLDNRTVTFVGDLKNGRTLHSTVLLASLYDNVTINLVSPENLRIPETILEQVKANNCVLNEFSDWNECLTQTDILYMTRVQKERFADMGEYERIKDNYILTLTLTQLLPETSIIMHPLPRVNEINVEVDGDPRAYYFEQAKNGLYVRMAILDQLLAL